MAPSTESVSLRVMVFNIEEGGAGVSLDQIVEAIRQADPDIVALQEAEGNAARIATALGWRFASARTQVIARWPILDPVDREPGLVFVEVRPGRAVAVMSVHPPAEPYGPELAAQGGAAVEIEALERRVRLPRLERPLAVLRGLAAAGVPVFLLGDFNAPSHLDWTLATVGIRPHVRLAMAWPVSRAIEAAGFRDTWREVHPDPVAEPGLTWWAERPPTGGYEPGPDTPDDRIDLIYAGGPAETTDCVIVGEAGRAGVGIGLDPWPSDHRAVVVTVRVFPASMPAVAGPAWPGSPDGFGAHHGGRAARVAGRLRRRRADRSDVVRRAGLPLGLDRGLPGTGGDPARRPPALAAHRHACRRHGCASTARRPSSISRRSAGSGRCRRASTWPRTSSTTRRSRSRSATFRIE